MQKPTRIADIHITLVLGSAEGFSEGMLEFLSDEAGDATESPEQYLIQIEDMLENNELSIDDIKTFIEDKRNGR